MKMKRVFVLCAISAWMFGLVILPTFAVERFKHLSGEQIKRVFLGRTVGDEAHWSYQLAADGRVESMVLGKKKQGLWRISRGELCLEFKDRGKPVSDCYEVWLSGNNVRLLRDGVMTAEGILFDE